MSTLDTMIAAASLAVGVVSVVVSILYGKREKKSADLQKEKIKGIFSGDDEYIPNVSKALEKLLAISLNEIKSGNEINISNFGLDLETVMPWFKNTILQNPDLENVQINYRGLIVNPQAPTLVNLVDGSSNIKSTTVHASLESAKHIQDLDYNGINLEIRSYSQAPFFHGFILNKRYLFISFTEVKNNKILGGILPYLYIKLDNASELNKHLFTMYQTWFEYIWGISESKVKISV